MSFARPCSRVWPKHGSSTIQRRRQMQLWSWAASRNFAPFEAAKLYQAGVAPGILYMDVKLNPATEQGLMPSEREITRRVLLSKARSRGGDHGRRQWCGEHLRRIARRPRLAVHQQQCKINPDYDRSFPHPPRPLDFPKGIGRHRREVHVHAIQLPQYGVTNWWRHEDGLIAFQTEFLKFAYYRLKY